MEPILQVENLSLSLKQNHRLIPLLTDVSFCLYEGERVSLIGESGSGKSQTVRTLLKLHPDPSTIVSSGKVLYRGLDLMQLNEKELRKIRGKEIGMIFQDPKNSLNPMTKIGDQILESYRAKHPHQGDREAHVKILELLSRAHISDPEAIFYLYPHQLSVGMCQKAMIALALAMEPKILIADEPTTALDLHAQVELLKLLKDLQISMGLTLLFITHDIPLVHSFSNRFLIMHGGQIIEESLPDELLSNPKHPYTRSLIQSLLHLPKQTTAFQESLKNILTPPSERPFPLPLAQELVH